MEKQKEYEIAKAKELSSIEVDLEKGDGDDVKSCQLDDIKDCRICQMSFEESEDLGAPIDLGCSCKDDLSAAHKVCAETWFKIKGDRICEICGSIAKNVAGPKRVNRICEAFDDANPPETPQSQRPNVGFCQSKRLLNFLLACMILAFFVSWILHSACHPTCAFHNVFA